MISGFLRRLVRRSPEWLQVRIREVRRRLPLTPSERWVSSEYTPFAMEERKRVFLSIARFFHINRPISGYYFEFGSHEANTIRMAWDCFRHLFSFDYVAFDSFQGLPEIQFMDEQEIWKKGKLRTEEERFVKICHEHGIPSNRLKTVKGFYDLSLTESLKQQLSPGKAAIVYVDCDLYHSTIPVLEFAKDFLQKGTIIVFDDWNCFLADPAKGERRAWREFRERYPDLLFEDFLVTGMQKAFVHVGTRAETKTTRHE